MDRQFTQGHALVIGVGSYRQPQIRSVPETAADAEGVADALRDPHVAGYPAEQVMLLCDESATRDGVLASLDGLAGKTKAADIVFLFFSGHGDYGTDGDYYLLTHEARLERQGGTARVAAGTGVSRKELLARLRAIPAERMVLIFNACHSGAVAPSLGAGDAAPGAGEQGLGEALPRDTATALLATGSGNVIITACREKQFSYIGPGPLTFFGQALVEGLRGSDMPNRSGYIGAFDLYNYLYFSVNGRVQQAIRKKQEPELSILKGVGPLAIARYAGSSAALSRGFEADEPSVEAAVRTVEPEESERKYQQIVIQSSVRTETTSGNVTGSTGTAIGPGARSEVTNRASQGGVVNTGRVGNINTGSGSQFNIGRIHSGRDTNIGNVYNQPNAALDAATLERVRDLLNELGKAAAGAQGLGWGTQAAIMRDAGEAKKAAADPQGQPTLEQRVASIAGTLKAAGEGAQGAAPLWGIVKNLAGLIGLPLP